MIKKELVGSYFLTFEKHEPSGQFLVQRQARLLEVVGQFAFVEYYSWFDGCPTYCSLVLLINLSDNESRLVKFYTDKEEFKSEATRADIHGDKVKDKYLTQTA